MIHDGCRFLLLSLVCCSVVGCGRPPPAPSRPAPRARPVATRPRPVPMKPVRCSFTAKQLEKFRGVASGKAKPEMMYRVIWQTLLASECKGWSPLIVKLFQFVRRVARPSGAS